MTASHAKPARAPSGSRIWEAASALHKGLLRNERIAAFDRSFTYSDSTDSNSDASEPPAMARIAVARPASMSPRALGEQNQGAQSGTSDTNQSTENRPQGTPQRREQLEERVPDRGHGGIKRTTSQLERPAPQLYPGHGRQHAFQLGNTQARRAQRKGRGPTRRSALRQYLTHE